MPIEAKVTGASQITATVGESVIDVSVGGGVGPTGSQGSSGVVSVSAPLVNGGSASAAQLSLSVGAGLQVSGGSLALASHTHTASQITDFNAAVVAAAPPTTNASLLTTGTLSASRLPASGVAAGTYSSVTVDTTGRVTAGGTHVVSIGDVSGLQTSLDGKAPANHVHSGIYDAANDALALYYDSSASGWIVTNGSGFRSAIGAAPLASPTFTGTVSGITASMVGLGNVPNVDARARSSHTGTQTASTISDFASAVASASPEEVIEATTVAGFPATGNTSALYVATDTSRFYRWVGTVYAEVGPVATYPATHTHTASQITGGTATTFLRGDGTFAAVGPALVLSVHTQTVAIAGNAETNLIYSTVTTDTDSAYSTTTGKYTVPAGRGGIYAVYMGFVADGATEGDTLADLKIFGTTLGEVSINGSSTYAAVDTTLRFAGMVFVSLTAGEEINLRSYATKALTANNDFSTFNVFKLFRM